ncbi:hypothetical protein MMC28_010949 [Mycoblastus sanguinarius]|nr:hypothetical protein [Mycoblastus sanguinarius]
MLFSKASMLLAVIVTAVYAAPAPLGVTRLDTFRKRDVASTLATQLSPGSTIVFPQDNSWENVTERWTLYQAPSFQVAVEPATEQDVVATVNFAVSRNISFLAQGGRHGYAPELQTIQNGVLINLEQLDHISVDGATGLATIGGGTVYDQVINATYAAGREMTVGSCPCVGVLGAGLGGGHGRLQGLHGLSIDAMRRLRVVLASGQVIDVTATEYSDLWWGIRGAGQNFGIVVEADFQTSPLVPQGLNYDVEMTFSDEKLEAVLELMNQQVINQPAQLAIDIIFGANVTTIKPEIAINFVYAGPQSDGQVYSAPWKELGPITFVEENFSWAELPTRTANGLIAAQCLKYGYKNTYSLNLKTFDTATMRSVYTSWGNFLALNPNVNASTILFEVYGEEAVTAVENSDSAYPSRDFENILTVLTSWYTDPSLTQAVDTWTSGIRAQMNATSGYDRLYVYQNYAHAEPLQAYYGYEPWRLQRLQDLKRKYDPHQIFSAYHPIPI